MNYYSKYSQAAIEAPPGLVFDTPGRGLPTSVCHRIPAGPAVPIRNNHGVPVRTSGVELYVLLTVLGHILLAMFVGAHAEVHGRRHWRWAPIVLVTGVLGTLWYVLSDPPEEGAAESPLSVADPPEDILERRPREKRLADPNTLHVDLPDGTTLTGSEQKAVSAVIERLDATGDESGTAAGGAGTSTDEAGWNSETGSSSPGIGAEGFGRSAAGVGAGTTDDVVDPVGTTDDVVDSAGTTDDVVDSVGTTDDVVDSVGTTDDVVDSVGTTDDRVGVQESDDADGHDDPPETETIVEEVFPKHNASYTYPDLWWTDCVKPALEALPEVDPPPDAEEYAIDLEIREVYDERPGTTLEATDGERTGRFRIVDGRVEAASSRVYAETSPRWAQYAKDQIADRWEERDWSIETGERATESARRR